MPNTSSGRLPHRPGTLLAPSEALQRKGCPLPDVGWAVAVIPGGAHVAVPGRLVDLRCPLRGRLVVPGFAEYLDEMVRFQGVLGVVVGLGVVGLGW